MIVLCYNISIVFFFFLMIRRPPRSTQGVSSAASDVYKRQIYNGELRHNSNSTGAKYGKKLVAGNVVGVMLDMIEGTLSFSINDQNFGIAFKDEQLKQGTLYAAVAALSQTDGCKLNFPLPEDQHNRNNLLSDFTSKNKHNEKKKKKKKKKKNPPPLLPILARPRKPSKKKKRLTKNKKKK
eukprot:TRINITY_DN9663_c0_g1_i5.p1 TRINITY_DN9663_c0_g1~~TRINITY_DN9663_c0_g1_i5.p1  ORF type:complete len:181 (+),score=55.43 TRINITY_DN9663_c0_g1_i5:72-614(+)